jgi:cytochrome c biogenesis factor
MPFLALTYLFIINNENYLYVAKYGSEDLPIRFRISAVWAAREGPLLLWAACCSIISFNNRMFSKNNVTWRKSTKILDGFILCLLLIAATLDPFKLTPKNTLIISAGLNPLLQTNLMVIHPPLIFAFYSSCVWIGCLTISHMINDYKLWNSNEFLDEIRIPAIISFGLGALGIGLGGYWAYTVLDWGGYWAWDPVETASLLPWISVMILLHLRLRKNKISKEWFILAGISPVWFSLLATLVTRAGGVWAGSVHSFVVDVDTLGDTNVWERILILKADDIAGIEIMTYLLILTAIFGTYTGSVLNQKFSMNFDDYDSLKERLFIWIFVIILIGPILVFIGIFDANIWNEIPIELPLFICGVLPIIIPITIAKKQIYTQLKKEPLRILMLLGMLILTIYIGDIILGCLLIAGVLFSMSYQNLEDGWPWIISTILILLFSSWSNLIGILEAGIGILLLSIPWIIMSQNEDEDANLKLSSLIYWSPIIISGGYLLLTWLILLSSIDGARFEAHELFGAPLLLLILSGLTAYGLQNKMENDKIISLILGVSIISLIFGWLLGDSLPNDSGEYLAGPITRGHIVWLLMPMTLMALPAISSLIYTAIKNMPKRKNKTHSLKTISAHLIHLGIILLIIGHLFATTSIDRGDLNHQVTLVRNETTTYNSLDYTFEEVVILKKSDLEFKDRFDVGDGYIGTIISIDDGKSITKIEPGVLRFDMPFETFPRSEVDRAVKLHGDIVVIFDLSQSQAMENMQNNDLENLEQIRVTIYDLPGSHLVWIGWLFMLIGSISLICINPRKKDPLHS